MGKKTDKTLLGIGRLIQVDGAAGTLISPATKTVTFEISALESGVTFRNNAGAGANDPPTAAFTQSSFFTNYRDRITFDVTAANSETARVAIPPPPAAGGRVFPQFKLRENSVTQGWYRIKLPGNVTLDPTNYASSIILAGRGQYGKKQPRYPTADGQFQYSSLRLDDTTVIEPLNNIPTLPYNPLTDPAPFENPIKVSFNTEGTPAYSSFAYVFEIPVYPLSAAPSGTGVAAGTWYIRNSYDSYWLDLDDGELKTESGVTGGSVRTGGAVLVTTGNPEGPTNFQIRIVRPPYKWKYNGAAPQTNLNLGGRDFNIWGLVVRLERTDGALIRYLEYYELTFELGLRQIMPNGTNPDLAVYPPDQPLTGPQPSREGEPLNVMLYGINVVDVHYLEPSSGITKSGQFAIMCDADIYYRTNVSPPTTFTENMFTGGPAGALEIPADHYYVVTQANVDDNNVAGHLNTIFNTNARGTYIIIATCSFDFPLVNTQNSGYPFTVIIVAANSTSANQGTNPNIRMGRRAHATDGVFKGWSTTNAFYFGKWPFVAPLVVVGNGANGLPVGTTLTATHPETVDGYTNPYATYGYVLNADGLYTDIPYPGTPAKPTAPPVGNAKFLTFGQPGGRVYNVHVDEYVNSDGVYDNIYVVNDGNLY